MSRARHDGALKLACRQIAAQVWATVVGSKVLGSDSGYQDLVARDLGHLHLAIA